MSWEKDRCQGQRRDCIDSLNHIAEPSASEPSASEPSASEPSASESRCSGTSRTTSLKTSINLNE